MAGFKLPDFKERAALSQAAKQKALEKMKAKPPLDPAEVARRQATQAKRDAAMEEKRLAREAAAAAVAEAKRVAEEAKRAEEAARVEAERLAEEEAAEAKRAKMATMPTPAQMKAARDARYAARKARQ